MTGGRGRDILRGNGGRDTIAGGPGNDILFGGPGADMVRTRDGVADVVECGRGRDRVIADRKDSLRGCEVVRRGR